MSTNDRATYWQRTLRAFLGRPIELWSTSGVKVVGELRELRANEATILVDGVVRKLSYANLSSVSWYEEHHHTAEQLGRAFPRDLM